MSIRLNKVTKDLNVGIQTVVEFLHKKGFTVEANPNAKISDDEFALLVKEFSKDKSLKQESEKIIQERFHKEKHKETVSIEPTPAPVPAPAPAPAKPAAPSEIKTSVPDEFKPKFKEVGKINLDDLNKKPAAPAAQPAPAEQPVVKAEPEKKEEVAPAPQAIEVKPEPVKVEEAPKSEPKKVEEEVFEEDYDEEESFEGPDEDSDNNDDSDSQTVSEEASLDDSDEPFRLNKPKFESNIKVVTKIDLGALNQTTRPKKKSKEEKRKEREAKDKQRVDLKKTAPGAQGQGQQQGQNRPNQQGAQQGQGANASADAKKKRDRIKREKVDIEKTGAQTNAGGSRPDNRQQQQGAKQPHQPKFKRPIKAEVSEEDVQKQIKETLARLTTKTKSKGAKYRREKRDAVSTRRSEMEEQEMLEKQVIKLTEFVTVNDLANMMDVSVMDVISVCMSVGKMVSINMRLDAELINLIAEEFGFKTEYVSADVVEAIAEEEDREEDLEPRSPIVTVMGHVDHGKTSLLDYIRQANVIAGEAGGITQHIGAYHVDLPDGRKITFLDTPGHEAFTAMRARGANVTDVAIIIVAADDGLMPQTIEAINHASAANVPMIFAINKIDKQGANPEKIKEALANMNYLVEDWGGKYQSQEISAKKGLNIDQLLEKVLLEAEMLDLKANPNKRATGSIIESSLDKGRGYLATVLVSNGTLKMGDVVLAGTHYGRVKAMFNERNQRVKEAGPAEPVLILGLNGAPQAGDTFHVLESEQEAREIATKREQLQREQGLRTQKLLTLDDIGRRIAIGNFQQLNVIVKGDVDGSVEALSDSLIKLSTEEIEVNVIHKAVGQISESDITLAAASNAIIIAFQVRPSASARRLAEKEGVDIRQYSVIYKAIEEVKAAMEGMLSPDIVEETVATLEVRETFKITKVGTVAGCMVKEGKIKRNSKIRLIRDGIVIYSGDLGSLKRFKDDVKEVAFGYECGLNIHNYNDLKVGDIIEAYE
ncbi:MAG: translation initiation factor IF-2 [Bacteroidota bacterium]|nr:translation initiation factor IF-2 [Bacteroidota bacterium]